MVFAFSFNALLSNRLALPSFLLLDTFKAASFLASLQATILILLQPATIRIAINARGIRLPKGGWCSKLRREHQIALIASLVDLPRKDTKDVLEHIDILMEGRMFSKEVPIMCRALAKIDSTKRKLVAEDMKELMTGREFSKEAPDMIRALAEIDSTKRKSVVAAMKELMTGREFPKEAPDMIHALEEIYPTKRGSVVAAMKELMTGREFPKEAPGMIRALANISKSNMEVSIQIIKDFMKGRESGTACFKRICKGA